MKWVFLLLGLVTVAVQAAPATVRLLQAPAWLERAGVREPLTAGRALEAGDIIRTGQESRAMLALAEGSVIKLGPETEFALRELRAPAEESGTFTGILDVLKGAFRFTTTIVGRKRDIRAQVGSATIGIRGTDVWGKSEDARDFVVLLEGSIDIERNGQSYPMATPLTVFMAPRDADALPVGPVADADLTLWAAETEPQAQAGIVSEQGAFRLNAVSYSQAAPAEAMRAQLAAAGYAAAVESAEVDDRDWWRLVIDGYASRADAQAVAARLSTAFGFASPWVSSRP